MGLFSGLTGLFGGGPKAPNFRDNPYAQQLSSNAMSESQRAANLRQQDYGAQRDWKNSINSYASAGRRALDTYGNDALGQAGADTAYNAALGQSRLASAVGSAGWGGGSDAVGGSAALEGARQLAHAQAARQVAQQRLAAQQQMAMQMQQMQQGYAQDSYRRSMDSDAKWQDSVRQLLMGDIQNQQYANQLQSQNQGAFGNLLGTLGGAYARMKTGGMAG